MWPFRKRGNGQSRDDAGGTAVVERPVVPVPTEVDDDFDGTDRELFDEIDRLTAANVAAPDRDAERRLVYLRHLAGIRTLVASAGDRPEYPEADAKALPVSGALPEIDAKDLTPGLLRAGILRDGCVLVRGLVPRDDALRFADQIDRAFAARDRVQTTGEDADGYYEEFEAGTPYDVAPGRAPVDPGGWRRAGGGRPAPDRRDAADLRRRRPAGAGGRLPGRARRWSRCRRPRCARPTRRSAAPGTRTERSWGRCGR